MYTCTCTVQVHQYDYTLIFNEQVHCIWKSLYMCSCTHCTCMHVHVQYEHVHVYMYILTS